MKGFQTSGIILLTKFYLFIVGFQDEREILAALAVFLFTVNPAF